MILPAPAQLLPSSCPAPLAPDPAAQPPLCSCLAHLFSSQPRHRRGKRPNLPSTSCLTIPKRGRTSLLAWSRSTARSWCVEPPSPRLAVTLSPCPSPSLYPPQPCPSTPAMTFPSLRRLVAAGGGLGRRDLLCRTIPRAGAAPGAGWLCSRTHHGAPCTYGVFSFHYPRSSSIFNCPHLFSQPAATSQTEQELADARSDIHQWRVHSEDIQKQLADAQAQVHAEPGAQHHAALSAC